MSAFKEMETEELWEIEKHYALRLSGIKEELERREFPEKFKPKPETGQVWRLSGEVVILTNDGENTILSGVSGGCRGDYGHQKVAAHGTYLGTFKEWIKAQKAEAVQAYADQVKACLSIEDGAGDSILFFGIGPPYASAMEESMEALAKLNPPIKA